MEQNNLAPVDDKIKPDSSRQKLTPVFDMVEESCKVYALNIKKFVEIYLRGFLGLIPFVAVIVLFFLSLVVGLDSNFIVRSLLVVLGFASILWAAYYGIRVRAAMILLIKNNYSSAKDNFTQTKSYFWAYIWVSLLVTIKIGLWGILLIIPGIIFIIYYLLVNYTLFFEDFKGRMALKRSKELVKGYWWPVLGRILFIALLAMVINFCLAAPLGFIEKDSASYVIFYILYNVIWALLAPITVIYTYYIFRDLVKIKGESKLEKKPTRRQNIVDAVIVILVFAFFIFISLAPLALNSARGKSRDAQTLLGANQLQIILELYNNENGTWPSDLEIAKQYLTDFDFSPYSYAVSGDSYKLCFNLEAETESSFGEKYNPGENCFEPELAPSL